MSEVKRRDYWSAAYRLLSTVSGVDDLKTQISLARLALRYVERARQGGAPA